MRKGIALLGGKPLPLGGCGVVRGDAQALEVEETEIVLGMGISLLGRGAKPFSGDDIIARRTITVVMHEAKIALADSIAGLRGKIIQLQGFAGIPRDAQAFIVEKSEIVGGRRVSLCNGSLIVLDSFGEIAFRAFPVLIKIAEDELRLSVSLRGRSAKPLYGRAVIRSGRSAAKRVHRKSELSTGIASFGARFQAFER